MANKRKHMKKTVLLFAALAFLTIQNYAQTVTDIDGNVYNTVTIGTQRWMKENLKVTHYRNGDIIPNVTDGTNWIGLTTGAYCYYVNDSSYFAPIFGALYNWYAVNDNRNIAPEGWHVPDTNEWRTLISFLNNNGGHMKDTSTINWESPNLCADNSSGFSSLAGGFRYYSAGIFGALHEFAVFWSTNPDTGAFAWHCFNGYLQCNAPIVHTQMIMGLSVRCIKDTTYNQVDENSIENRLQLYPNPVTDKICIINTDRQKFLLSIYNLAGDLLIKKDLNKAKEEIDINNLASGMYIIKLIGADWIIQKKIIKQ
jgi:uncharacterized protein (TIGR02145 family)